jgi:DNA-binding NtrC family response regulator
MPVQDQPHRYQAVVIDDDEDLLEGLRVALRAEPYDLHTVTRAAAGIKLLQDVRPDVVVSDYQLPDAMGTAILTQARQLLPDSCRILMTGMPSLEMAMDAINKGAITRLFLKPFKIMDLAIAVREGMERAEMARLSSMLLERAQHHSAMIEKIKKSAPELFGVGLQTGYSPTGAQIGSEYSPHDWSAILKALRREFS